jgi:hypothetical protein
MIVAALLMPLLLGSSEVLAQLISAESSSTRSAFEALPAAPIEEAIATPFSLPAPEFAMHSEAAGVQLPPLPLQNKHPHAGTLSTVSLGLTGSTLGSGMEFATPLASMLNLRVGGNYFQGAYPFTIDGVNYSAGMQLTSGQATIDWFPTRGGFHVSAGALYFKNTISASADVAPGKAFRLGDTSYINSVDDPIHGSASLTFPKKMAPVVLVGFGNLIPRSGRHISVPIEFGGAYVGQPHVAMQLAGTACTLQGCFDAATDAQIHSSLASEQAKLNSNIRLLQVYPILSLGLAVRF